VSRYQISVGETNLDFTEARDSEWQWHQLGHMQVCTLLQTDNHASTPPLSCLQAGCPSCRPTNSVKALKAKPVANISISTSINPYRRTLQKDESVMSFARRLTTWHCPRLLLCAVLQPSAPPGPPQQLTVAVSKDTGRGTGCVGYVRPPPQKNSKM